MFGDKENKGLTIAYFNGLYSLNESNASPQACGLFGGLVPMQGLMTIASRCVSGFCRPAPEVVVLDDFCKLRLLV